MYNKLNGLDRQDAICKQDLIDRQGMEKSARLDGNYSYDYIADENNRTAVMALEDHIMRLEPGLVNRLERGIDVADINCGTGQAINQLAKLYPNSRFTGFDACAEDIIVAKMEADEMGLSNIRFEAVDPATLGSEVVFDFILPSTRYMIRRFEWQQVHNLMKINASN
ncbi:MAG: class I SAM-dependent methyltransferase [Sphingorhabdus sp.]|uniref:class I SAM-dependent methyltransferase n=1 Tax=Sphingorhabdus sp. TaxID=1902408 RepID=UPI0038FC32E5